MTPTSKHLKTPPWCRVSQFHSSNSLANSLPMGSSGNQSFNTDNVGFLPFIPIDMHFRVIGDSKLPLSVSVFNEE